MQTFKTFINEQAQMDPLFIEVDKSMIENNKDAMNADFDRLTAAPYQNSIVFYNQLRGTLERYGIVVPPGATRHFLNFDSELSFQLGDSGLYLYVVFNTHKNAKVEGYVQVVDEAELNNLMNSDEEVPREDEEEEEEGEEEGEMEEKGEEKEEMEDDEEEMSYGEKYRKRMDDDG
jgi:hypothetical protein